MAPTNRVLVVDNAQTLAPLYKKAVDLAGGTCDIARDCASARKKLNAGSFACAIVDKRLPDGDGVTLADEIKTLAPGTEVLLVSDMPSVNSALHLLRLGAFDYLVKPFDAERLAARLKDALERSQRAVVEGEKVQRLEEELLRAERLVTLGTLAGGVGHELNNICTVYLSVASHITKAAKDGRPPDPRDLEDLKWIGDHLRAHARNLLELGRPGPDHTAQLDMREVVESVVRMLHTVGKTKLVEVVTGLPKQPVNVTVNRTRVEQILINLVGNAADAISSTGHRGIVRVDVWRDFTKPRVWCRVEDNGCGIPAALLERVFDPYFTTKAPGKGTGLGLGVARQVVDSYGGKMQLHSEEGRGTVFLFDLPAA